MTHPAGRRVFITAATQQYSSPRWKALPVASEVAALERWLCNQQLLGERAFDPPIRWTDPAGPTAQELQNACTNHGQGWSPHDAVVLYVTGHGEVLGKDEHWLILRDTADDAPLTNGLRSVDLIRWLMREPAPRVLLLDTCEAGVLAEALAHKDFRFPDNWVVLTSTARHDTAHTLYLTNAITRTVQRLGELFWRRYEMRDTFFAVEDFVTALTEPVPQRGRVQTISLVPGSQVAGPHLCLPNPHYVGSTRVDTAPAVHELAFDSQDILLHAAASSGPDAADGQPGTDPARRWLYDGRPALARRMIAVLEDSPAATVVAGPARSGKTSALRRLVTLSDPTFRRTHREHLRDLDADLLPPPDSIRVAIDATDRAPDALLADLAQELNAGWDPRTGRHRSKPGALSPAGDLGRRIARRRTKPITVVVDAVDASQDPTALGHALADLVQASKSRLRLILGVRCPDRADGATNTDRSRFSPAGTPWTDPPTRDDPAQLAESLTEELDASLVRLDDDSWWDDEDVRIYVENILRRLPGSPYTAGDHAALSHELATAIAGTCRHSFLFAHAAAMSLAQRAEPLPADDSTWRHALADGVIAAFRLDLHRLADQPLEALPLFQALAYGRGRGLPARAVWPAVANAVANSPARYGEDSLRRLLQSPLSAYLLDDREDGCRVYRIAHPDLKAALRDHPEAFR